MSRHTIGGPFSFWAIRLSIYLHAERFLRERPFSLRKIMGTKVLQIIEFFQRERGERLGVRLGNAVYCMAALVIRGLVNIPNLNPGLIETDYSHLLAQYGITEKALLNTRVSK
jgi:hypothetical protein